jgi:hypothetical protein
MILVNFAGRFVARGKWVAPGPYFAMPEAAIGRDDAVSHVLLVGEIPTLLIP